MSVEALKKMGWTKKMASQLGKESKKSSKELGIRSIKKPHK